MIQDIAPHNFEIKFEDKKPDKNLGKNNISLIFCKDKILLKVCEDVNTGEEIVFPSYDEMCDIVPEQTYLFSLDEVDYFRGCIEPQSDHNVDMYPDIPGYIWQTREFFRLGNPKELALVGITGMHLNGWYLKNKFCGACGNVLTHDKKERMLKCPCCNNMVYPRINPAVIVAVTDGDRLLLTKYRGREYKKYALVAGFVEIGESFEDTVKREVMEEAGLRVKNIRYYKSQPWGFTDNILAGYFCEVDGDTTITMDDEELSVAEWVERKDIDVQFEDLSLTNEMIHSFKVDKKIPPMYSGIVGIERG